MVDVTVALMVLMTVEKMAYPWAWLVSVKVYWWVATKVVAKAALLDESWAGARGEPMVESKVVMMDGRLADSKVSQTVEMMADLWGEKKAVAMVAWLDESWAGVRGEPMVESKVVTMEERSVGWMDT